MNKNHKKLRYIKGMTLIELMVVIGLLIMVAGLTIFDYGRFKSNVSLQNLADDIALSVRRAQNYAIGVKNTQASFSSGYGIHFSLAQPGGSLVAGSNKSFIIFNDVFKDKQYNFSQATSDRCDSTTLSPGSECIDLITITSPDYISAICPYQNATCTPIKSGTADITFLRPNPDAYICVKGSGPSGACPSNISKVDIIVKNIQSGDTKTITISNVGEISIR